MRVLRARKMGFCFGVRRALELIEGISDPASVTIRGELVHNEQVLGQLRSSGFAMLSEDELDGVPSTPGVLITAHGISHREKERLLAGGRTLLDTTCPLVTQVHEAAERLARQVELVLVFGREGHVEVRGIVEDLARSAVVASPDQVRRWDAASIGIVCQSTFPPRQVPPLLVEVRRQNPRARIELVETICRPTRERQLAVEELAGGVQAIVVVGGRNSNNTRALARRVEELGLPFFAVRSAEEIDVEALSRFEIVGLTAGTSTPEEVIAEVEARLLALETRAWSPAAAAQSR